ncbi:siderophore-interacting protein [Rathayibacter iranicus]|uniref:NADPH-dependent ferric siderophore reductase n=4 Tax=Rathayibacter iranicus TaxID=59737 RepID=A0AAD2JFW6_9MICO|nr:siderophore-interacting protein [Rathayibacter iranicus]AZZ54578.1 NADPH-dependent ferric siderophore reductase [Rathayibacter iranicus]MWV30360.1 siderophore-interacting protein [Rathayibacter iranicus NCPPB 2253 = VKM Ac-1602]PWJ64269.1 NADPH-dependent ferric siderophore reductase [Rathayibacter iranicus NCPPB 2253 = VKM Ac-1602]
MPPTTTAPARPPYRPYLATVARATRIAPHFIRVTLTGADLDCVGCTGPDQRIKLVVPTAASGAEEFMASVADEDGPDGLAPDWYTRWRDLPDELRNPLRTYTIRATRPELAEVDVDFAAHGDAGPASAWAESACAGQRIVIIAPDIRSELPGGGVEFHPGAATSLLLAGDETAVPAIAAILESLGDEATGAAFLEVPSALDRLALRHPAGVSVTWIVRESVAAPGAALGGAVRSWATRFLTAHHRGVEVSDVDIDSGILWEVPEESSDPGLYAWIAGEAGAVKLIRRCLVTELGLDRRRVAFMGYWRTGRSESN